MGDTVLVFGAGPIGLMHLMLARLSGAAKVIVVDVQTHRLIQAAALGASSTVNSAEEDLREHVLSETAGRGANVVITACAVPAVQEQSLGLLAPFGRVCFFGGLPKDGSLVRLDTNIVHYKQLLLTGVTGGSPSDFRTALTLIASGRIQIEKIVSHSFPMTDLANAFDLALKGEPLKIVLRQEETVGQAMKTRIDGMSDVSSPLISGLPAESEEANIP
jgi:L-iditol 2-dehydrogenase